MADCCDTGGRIADYFSEEDLSMVEEVVKRAESKTSGEIRVKIRMRCDAVHNGDVEAQAIADFKALGLTKTRDRTGVLVLVVLGERKIRVLADEGINAVLESGYLQSTADQAASCFKYGRYGAGLWSTVLTLGRVLARNFPKRDDDTNELPDKPVLEEK